MDSSPPRRAKVVVKNETQDLSPPRPNRKRPRRNRNTTLENDLPPGMKESEIEWGKKVVKTDGEDQDNDGDDSEQTEERDKKKKPKVKKVAPNLQLSGKLAAEAGTTASGIVLKHHEPLEAHLPNKKWRLHPFKGDQALAIIPVYRQSSYLFGRDRNIVDIPTDHPSCSQQHAVLQHREISIQEEEDLGETRSVIKPYIMDLASSNGTFLNGKKISSRRYIELFPKDVLKFGQSSREYVLLFDELATK